MIAMGTIRLPAGTPGWKSVTGLTFRPSTIILRSAAPLVAGVHSIAFGCQSTSGSAGPKYSPTFSSRHWIAVGDSDNTASNTLLLHLTANPLAPEALTLDLQSINDDGFTLDVLTNTFTDHAYVSWLAF